MPSPAHGNRDIPLRQTHALWSSTSCLSEEDANALLQFGWCASYESVPCLDEIWAWASNNAQNAECKRELSIIATGISRPMFCARVSSRLPRADADYATKRKPMNLYDVLAIVGDGLGLDRVCLISRWKPDRQLRTKLIDHLFKFTWRPLNGIPVKDLDKVRTFHLWHGSRRQGASFLRAIWGRGS